jgi:hypothetical protein
VTSSSPRISFVVTVLLITWIGNAVPCDAAAAIASTIGRTLLLSWSGETFGLSSTPIWVRPVAVALAVDLPILTMDGAIENVL